MDILELYKKISKQHNIPLEIVSATGAQESSHGRNKKVEPRGMTKGVFHVTRDAAIDAEEKVYKDKEKAAELRAMSKKQFMDKVANDPELDAKYAGGYLDLAYKKSGGDPVKTYGLYNAGVYSKDFNEEQLSNQKKFKEKYDLEVENLQRYMSGRKPQSIEVPYRREGEEGNMEMMTMMGSGGDPRKKKDEEIAKDIVSSKALPIAEDAAIQKKQMADKIVKQEPKKVKEIVNNLPIDDKTKKDVKTDINNQVKGKERDPLSAQFTDALTYFLPTIIGGIGGALFEGNNGALAGMEAGQQAGEGYRNFRMEREKLDMQGQQLRDRQTRDNVDASNFVDDQGRPVKADLSKGIFTDLQGNLVDPAKIQRTNIFKQSRTLEQEQSKQEGINTRFRTKFKLDEAKAAQFTDKQTEQLKGYSDVLDSIGRIEDLKGKVDTGKMANFLGTAQEMFDVQPAGFTELKSETSDAVSKYTKALSGTQVSEGEADRLGRIIPNTSDNDKTFKRKLAIFKGIMENNRDNFLKAIKDKQPLKNIPGLDAAVAEIKAMDKEPKEVEPSKQQGMSEDQRKRYEELKAKYNK